MLPTNYQRLNAPPPLFKVAFSKVAVFTVSLVMGAFIYAIVWSLIFDFERATYTHCEVKNYLPSISAAIGNYQPQRTVWTMAVVLHLPLRLAVAHIYYQYYREHIRRQRQLLAFIAVILNVIENFALFSLSLWTSTDYYSRHKKSFIIFIACSEMYMLLSYLLNRNSRVLSLTQMEEKSVRYKGGLLLTNIISSLLAVYCFARHNSKCETGVYTLFAFFEYVVVLTNMAYHMTAYWDFYGLCILYDWKHGLYLSHM